MEVRSTVNAIRHFAHCIRQQRLFPIATPALRSTCFLKNSIAGTTQQTHCFHSRSSCHGLTLKMHSCRFGDALVSRMYSLHHEANIMGHCMGSVRGMAGHSKWANIRHIKAAKDSQKARAIAEFSRKLRAFIRETGQSDPKTSSQLAKLIAEAKTKNIPNANIDRVLAQMSSLKNSSPIMYAAKGPGGSVMLIEAITNKMTQTRSELQSIVKKCGFSVFDSGSLARITFEEKGVVQVGCPEASPDLDRYVDIAIEAGAEDVTLEEDEEGSKVLQFVCDPVDVYAVKKELEARQLPISSVEVVYNTISSVSLDSSTVELIAKAMEKLDEHPDVLRVYINVDEAS